MAKGANAAPSPAAATPPAMTVREQATWGTFVSLKSLVDTALDTDGSAETPDEFPQTP